MADGPVHTGGSDIDDDIARAFLRRGGGRHPAMVARAALGDIVRNWQGRLQDGRRVSSLARLLGVERKFLYRVFGGSEWRSGCGTPTWTRPPHWKRGTRTSPTW
jgi:hypothetical protein